MGGRSQIGRKPAEERVFRPTLLHLADRIGTRLRPKSRAGRTVTVLVRGCHRSGRLGCPHDRRCLRAGRDWERGRLGLAGFFSAAASLTTSDLNAERVLRRRIGFASDFKSASVAAGCCWGHCGAYLCLTIKAECLCQGRLFYSNTHVAELICRIRLMRL